MVPNALTEMLQTILVTLRYFGTFVRSTVTNVSATTTFPRWLLKLPSSFFLGMKSMVAQDTNLLIRQVNGIQSIFWWLFDIKKMFRYMYRTLFETNLLHNISSMWLKLRNGLFFAMKSMVVQSSNLLMRQVNGMQSNFWWLLDIRNVFGWTYHVLFETYLLQNISCALLLGALVSLYLATDTEHGSISDEKHWLPQDIIPRPSNSTSKNKTNKTSLSLSSAADYSKRRDADFSLFAYTKAKLFPSVSSPMNNLQQIRQMADDTIALRTPQRSYTQTSSPSTATSSPYRNNPSSSSSIHSSPGGLSSIVYSHGSDDDDDDLSIDDQGRRRRSSLDHGHHEEIKGKYPSGRDQRDVSHQNTIIKESATNPAVLIGWQINIRHKGLGLVLGIKKRMGRATLFRVQMDSGEVQMLSLKRSKTKGDLSFIPVTRL